MANNDIKNYPELRAYLEGSNESDITRENLMRILEKELRDFPKNQPLYILDVGSSDGEMSLPLIKLLKRRFVDFRYTAIEPERPAFEKLNENIKKQRIDYAETYNTTIEEYLKKVSEEKELFDLILFAQCLYHMPKEEWDEIITDSIRLLKPNGMVIIILDSHEGQAYELKDLITQGKADTLEFGDLYSVEDITNFLVKKGIQYSIEKFPIYIFVEDNKQKLFEFARYLAFLYRTFPEKILANYKKPVEKFLEEIKKGNRYILENLVKVVIFRK